MDYYSKLGLTRGASDADIKKAYRSMAMKHHPDRGGDQAKFKEIEEAYRTLSDPEKKQIFDLGGDPNHQGGGGGGNPFEFRFNNGNFQNFGDIFGFGQRSHRRNASFNVNIEISLEDVLIGKEVNAEVGMPNGRKKIVNISIPPGIEHGQQIRYSGMGDHSMPDVPPGDLLVNVILRPHIKFRREGSNIIYDTTISAWDAMLGATLEIDALDNKKLNITIPPGSQPDTVLSCRGEGLPNMQSRIRGNLLIRIKVTIPKNLTAAQIETINSFKNNN